jgi:hypothetical protein
MKKLKVNIIIQMLIESKISYQEAFHRLMVIDAPEYVDTLPH